MKELKKLAVFDIDGTILDTGQYIFQAYKYTLALHLKKEVNWEDVVPILGLPFKECYRILTNLEEVDNVQKALDLGATNYMVKSDFSLKDVVEKIRASMK